LLAGTTLGAMLPPPIGPWLPLIGAATVGMAAVVRRAGPALLMVCAAALAHALVVGAVDAQLRCEERVLVQARITGLPARVAPGWRFEAMLRHPRQPGRADVRAMVEMPRGKIQPAVGETWQLLLRYQPVPADAAGGADPLRLAVRDRRQASARVLPSPLNRRIGPAATSIDGLRQRVALRIQRRALDPAAGALLAALAVGATGEVTSRQWRDFSATGITHLVAISGAHVTFFALLSMAAVRRLWNVLPGLQHRVRRERLAGLAGLVLALAYALLSGFSVPAQRTLLMLAAFVLWRESGRASRPCWSLAVAMCAVLAIDPLAILGAGFWLSFAAVAAILLLPGSRLGEEGSLRSGARVQAAVSLALLPLTVLLFGSFSFSGLLVNAGAIPLFGFVLVPGALLATLAYLLPGEVPRMAGDLLIDCAGAVASLLLPLLARAAQWSASSWLGAMPLPQLLLTAISVACGLLPLRPSVRVAAIGLAFSGLVATPRAPPAGTAELDVLGAGAGTSVVVTTASHRLVFGTGEVHGGDGRRFRARVVDRLQREGGPVPGILVTGRARAERLAAATAAAARWPGIVIVGERATQPLPPELVECDARRWQWDEVGFELLSATPGRGCALRIATPDGSALLTLDVDGPGWDALQARGTRDRFVLLPLAAGHLAAADGSDAAGGGDAAGGAGAWLLGQRQHSATGLKRWQQLEEVARQQGHRLLDASVWPALRVRIGGKDLEPGPLQRWRWGAWAGRLHPGCHDAQAGQR
jgi:competence protein ComEC